MNQLPLASVDSLRKAGFKVRVTHYRYTHMCAISDSPWGVKFHYGEILPLHTIRSMKIQDQIIAKGGLVEVEVLTPDGHEVTARSECSGKDSYNNRVGVTIALSRALKKYEDLLILKALEKQIGDGTGT